MTDGRQPLSGVVVVEAASFVSGPLATMLLADFGADVIKLEPPAGDAFRRFGRPSASMSPLFAACNTGKRSVALDLKDAAAQEQARAIVDRADVFVCNWRPSVAARLGLDDGVLAARNPRLIRAYITGYGASGPFADLPAFDSIIQARSGATEAFGNDGPALAYGYLADKLAAWSAVHAILAALYARDRGGDGRAPNGTGERLDIAMLDAAASFNFSDVFSQRIFLDHPAEPARNPQPGSNRPLPTRDGWIVVAPVTGTQIRNACAAVGHPEWINDLKPMRDVVAMTELMLDRMEVITRRQTTAHWLAAFASHDVAAGPCLGIDDHLADAAVAANDLYRIEEWPGIGRVRRVRAAPRHNGDALPLTGRAPAIGEHTDEIVATSKGTAT